MNGGFYKRRRGILEHLEAGRLSLLDLGIHDFLCLRANQIVGMIAGHDSVFVATGSGGQARELQRLFRT